MSHTPRAARPSPAPSPAAALPVQPEYQRDEKTGRAYSLVDGVVVPLGDLGSQESIKAYGRLCLELKANNGLLPGSQGKRAGKIRTVQDMVSSFLARTQWRNGIHQLRLALKPLCELYGDQPINSFGPIEFKAVRQKLIDQHIGTGKPPLTHRTINHRMGIIRSVFRRAVDAGLLPVAALHSLIAVMPLRRVEEETDSRGPHLLSDAAIDAVKPYVSSVVWSMICLQRFTGMWTHQIVCLRTRDIDSAARPWLIRCRPHASRTVQVPPMVQLDARLEDMLRPLLVTGEDDWIFDSRASWRELAIARYLSKGCSLIDLKSERRNLRRSPFCVETYRVAVLLGCDKADAAEQRKLGKRPGRAKRIVERWTPDMLRRNYEARSLIRPAMSKNQPAQVAHSNDFTSINWHGVTYKFSKGRQADSVRALFEAYQRGAPTLSEMTIAEKIEAESDSFRLAHVFRRRQRGRWVKHPAWGTLIRPVAKGAYELFSPREKSHPQKTQNHTQLAPQGPGDNGRMSEAASKTTAAARRKRSKTR